MSVRVCCMSVCVARVSLQQSCVLASGSGLFWFWCTLPQSGGPVLCLLIPDLQAEGRFLL